MQIHQYLIDDSASREHIMQNSRYDNPGQEMWQIRDGLNNLFPAM